MAIRCHRLRKGVTPGAEPSSDGQNELDEFGEDGIGHLRVLDDVYDGEYSDSTYFLHEA